ncbi:hypothetical protein MMC24_001809 [Lignoscripta atroalba]|nr:hypothetical protein [Lignoscripta atroalba]
MVRLPMTHAIVKAIEVCSDLPSDGASPDDVDGDPSLLDPAIGMPISHGQVISLYKRLRNYYEDEADTLSVLKVAPTYHLDDLLRGSKIYIEPSKPKPEPSPEYKSLMARLRKEEEARAYERMINPPLPTETYTHRFPASQHVTLFSGTSQPNSEEDDEITYADINRQMALIINIMISIVACSVAIWMASSHWTTPKRLGLSMGGSGMIGVAEVVVYAGYLRRLRDAKEKGKKEVETKEIIKTWVIGGDHDKSASVVPKSVEMHEKQSTEVRRRNRLPRK